ncbi:MAG: 30S ribosomal protein S4 [Armatimonadota bacterium]
MARYHKAVCRLCRRSAQKLYLKGYRCYTPKCAIERRNYAPGQHGQSRRRPRKPSDYALQLREKQKAKHFYGLMERQFRRYYQRAARSKGITGEAMLAMLESRLDNVVFRAGLASSRREARHLTRHRHFTVNGRIVDIPSYEVRPNDVVQVKPSSRNKYPIVQAVNAAGSRTPVPWLSVDLVQMSATMLSVPTREGIDADVSEQLVVEYYSR